MELARGRRAMWRAAVLGAVGLGAGCSSASASAGHDANADAAGSVQPLVVQILDVGQGDATLIRNGASRILIDGGPSTARFGALLDSLGLNGSTIDVVIVSHAHLDHYNGLRELFRTNRRIRVRYVFENGDPSPNVTLQALRDSVHARVRRGETLLRDTDDPCNDGRPVCTLTLAGGAKLHVMRPHPRGRSANDRSTPVKLVGPDSASFTMWLAGDAEYEALRWFDSVDYDVTPGMRATVLKANHHGSRNGMTPRYLELVAPEVVTFSAGAGNSYGHVHPEAVELIRRQGARWYRTDEHGTVTLTAPGTPRSGYRVQVQRGSGVGGH